MNLEGKVAFITGAGSGIGRQIAINMAECKAKVVVSDLDFTLAKTVVYEIEKMKQIAFPIKCDVTNYDEVEFCIDETLTKFDRIDILVNNAGLFKEANFLSMSKAQWDQHINVNLTGVFNVTKAVVPTMVKNNSGNIINISSVDAFQGCRNYSHYSAAKAGVLGFTKTLALELAPYNIRVNAIAPGITETNMSKDRIKKYKNEYLKSIPLNRIGTPLDIANAVIFLASERSSYITGQTLHVNGGVRLN